MLRWLVVEEVLAEENGGRFALTELGGACAATCPGRCAGRSWFAASSTTRRRAGLLRAALRGDTAFEQVYGDRFFEHLARDPDREAAFQASMDRGCTTGPTPTPTDCWGPAGRR
jgi:hypothetical protein